MADKPITGEMSGHIQNIVADFDMALFQAQARAIGRQMNDVQHTGQEFGGSQAVASVLDNSTSRTI